ncbi:hypothetical protein BU14_2724s0001, partial [Porphyra umbilicalis]
RAVGAGEQQRADGGAVLTRQPPHVEHRGAGIVAPRGEGADAAAAAAPITAAAVAVAVADGRVEQRHAAGARRRAREGVGGDGDQGGGRRVGELFWFFGGLQERHELRADLFWWCHTQKKRVHPKTNVRAARLVSPASWPLVAPQPPRAAGAHAQPRPFTIGFRGASSPSPSAACFRLVLCFVCLLVLQGPTPGLARSVGSRRRLGIAVASVAPRPQLLAAFRHLRAFPHPSFPFLNGGFPTSPFPPCGRRQPWCRRPPPRRATSAVHHPPRRTVRVTPQPRRHRRCCHPVVVRLRPPPTSCARRRGGAVVAGVRRAPPRERRPRRRRRGRQAPAAVAAAEQRRA